MNNEIQLAMPLILITATALIATVIDAFTGTNKKPVYEFSLVGLIITLIASAYTLFIDPVILPAEELISKGMITYGGYAAFFDVVFCLAALMTLFAARPYLVREEFEYKEFYLLILYSIIGMMLISHTNNLLILFIGIEIMSICFYVLAGYFRKSIKSVEAALKYFLLGAFATGFLVYGMAMIYGGTGSFDIPTIAQQVRIGEITGIYLTIGVGLLLIGLSFKVAAFPFHQWAPDVYHGSPTVVTAFMSTAGKAAALIGFIVVAKALITFDTMNEMVADNARTTQMIVAFISAATMLVGNITAVVQRNVKRMLAYSSVAHAGYMLMGVVANTALGYSGILFYVAAYTFMQIGSFIVVSILEREKDKYQEFDDYSGLYKAHPMLAAMMALFMLSLAGIPPMAGFFGKYYLFLAAIKSGFTWLTIVAVISTIISIYFYIGLIVQMYFRAPETELPESKPGTANITLALSTIGVLVIGIFPSLVIDLANSLF